LLPLRAGSIHFSAPQEPASQAGVDGETPHAERSHYIGHADGLKAGLTALENLEFWARMLSASARALTPSQALQKVGLGRIGDFPVGYLSAGQKRRVALARLFVAPRPVWLLDEPATALDVGSQQQLAEAMAAHRAGGGFIIAATHAPLGLADAQELRLDASRAASPAGAAG
jgi:heme exporter protein A